MQPRLSQSKTWTNFPNEFLDQIQDLVSEAFDEHLIEDARIHLEGRIYPEEILFRLGVHIPEQIKQSNFEVSANYNPESKDAKKIMHHCIEAAAAMMAEYFEMEDDESFPRQWMEFNFEGTPLFVQYSTVNNELESEADKLLGTNSGHLVSESESQDALDYIVEERIEMGEDEDLNAGLDDDGDDDDENDDGETEGRQGSRAPTAQPKKGSFFH